MGQSKRGSIQPLLDYGFEINTRPDDGGGYGFMSSIRYSAREIRRLTGVYYRAMRKQVDLDKLEDPYNGWGAAAEWYSVVVTERGPKAARFWWTLEQVPNAIVHYSARSLVQAAVEQWEHPDLGCYCMEVVDELIKDTRVTDEDLEPLLDCEHLSLNLWAFLSRMRPSQIQTYAERIRPQLERLWLHDLDGQMPEKLVEVTKLVVGCETLARLQTGRARYVKLLEETERACQAAEKAQREAEAAEVAAERRIRIAERVAQFREDARGIRLDPVMSRVCLACGSGDVETKSMLRWQDKVCQTCRTEWYTNRCWRCHAPVDSRDPETPECLECHWHVCAECGACSPWHTILRERDGVDSLKGRMVIPLEW